jgi:hypothetical protein
MMNMQDILNHTLRALDPQQPRNRSSFAPVEGSTPTADVGTADVGDLPVSRYWTVKIEARGRIHYVHVQACDAWKATTVALKGNRAAISAQIVREIDKDEFEHLTRVPA